ncbi:ATP-grasp domain-containing protein [Rhodoligotrophos ferricapiens]|uniref:ATP-grasp domain-containing protein n=1 Tax=Rhodoligotrophos ferricapiens TaxID=3069264 RepID=UPI00315CA211
MRILLSEGSSTSAREAITVLGLQGHHVEIVDPDPHCIGRFSRFVRRYHRCPGLGVDPEGFVEFILHLVETRPFDVLLPIHEQGMALSKTQQRLLRSVSVALPSFESYRQAHSKAAFSTLLTELGLPQPATRLLHSRAEALALKEFPIVLKTAIGTASRGVWFIRTGADLYRAVEEIAAARGFDEPVLAQEWIEGAIEHAQALFRHGELIGLHAYRQIIRGAGGGDAVKESIHRPELLEHMSRLGRYLDWHGALSVDYLAPDDDGIYYIDCNPRLVEPMSAFLAGHDLLGALLKVSIGETPPPLPPGTIGLRTHLALQALLGCALRSRSRMELMREARRLVLRKGMYRFSQEELTPLQWDWPSITPTVMVALLLFINPNAAENMPKRGWGSHLLTPESIRIIHERIGEGGS